MVYVKRNCLIGKTNHKTAKNTKTGKVNIINTGHIRFSSLPRPPCALGDAEWLVGVLCLRIMHPLEDGVVGIHGIRHLERWIILLCAETVTLKFVMNPKQEHSRKLLLLIYSEFSVQPLGQANFCFMQPC